MSDNKTADKSCGKTCPTTAQCLEQIGNDEIKNTFAFCEEYKSF